MARLQSEKVSLGYGDAQVVHDLTLTVPDGQVTTIIGANGCGKSTLLKSLARLLRPTDGSVLLATMIPLPSDQTFNSLAGSEAPMPVSRLLRTSAP